MAQEVGETTGADAARAASPGGGKGIFDHLTDLLIQGQSHKAHQAQDPVAQPQSPAAPPPAQLPATRPDDPFAVTGRTFLFPETAEELVVEKEVVVREQVSLARLFEAHVRETENATKAETVEALPPPTEEAIALPPQPPEEAIALPPPPEEAIPLPPPPQEQVIAAPAPPAEEAIALPPPSEPVAPLTVEAVAPAPAAPPPPEARRLVFGGPEDAAALRAAAARPAAPQPDRAAPAKRPAGWGLGSWAWFILLFCMAALVAFYGGQYLGELYAGAEEPKTAPRD